MSLFGRAATLIGLAAGGAAAARAVANLTPSEREALYEVLTAGVDLLKQQAGRLGAQPRADGRALAEPRDRYRAGPLRVDRRFDVRRGGAVGQLADVRGAVAHHQEDDRHEQQREGPHKTGRPAPSPRPRASRASSFDTCPVTTVCGARAARTRTRYRCSSSSCSAPV